MSLEFAIVNLTSLPVLAFMVGAIATFARTDFRLPEGVKAAITIYLLLAIGLKGGAELSASSFGAVWLPASAALLIGLAIPVWSFLIARRIGRLSPEDSAALGAHYGSVSVVTFTACLVFLDARDVEVEGFMSALLALLEAPAIVVALLLVRDPGGEQRRWRESLHETLAGHSMILLGGGIFIGFVAGKDGFAPAEPLFVEPFYGVLVLFLLEMGRSAAARLNTLAEAKWFLIAFATIMPLLHGVLGVAVGHLVGLSTGGATVMGVLAASASYIAAPAAMQVSLPKANPGYYLTTALGVTFPFNLVIGIPVYYQLALMFG